MSETASTAFQGTNPLINPVMYWRVTGFALAAIALLGIIMSIANDGAFISGFLEFDWGHNIVHVVLAAAAFIFGFAPVSPAIAKTFAIVFGFVYLALGVLGFFVSDLGILQLELGENLVHILIAAWALTAGFLADY